MWSPGRDAKTNDLRLADIGSKELEDLAAAHPSRRIWFLTDAFRLNKQRPENDRFLHAIAGCTVYKGADHLTSVYLFSSDNQRELVCLKQER
jgi:hypothetical protein